MNSIESLALRASFGMLLLAWLPSQPLQANSITGLAADPNGFSAIAAGGDHTCAITQLGVLKCWGITVSGLLGEPPDLRAYPPSPVPVTVPGFAQETTKLVAVSEEHSCAISQSGAAKCWGVNTRGQLGNGTLNPAVLPVPVIGLGIGVKSVGVGSYHSCALASDNGVKCWGLNNARQLGDNTVYTSTTPLPVGGLEGGVLTVTVGSFHNCAIMVAGGVKCWGDNSYGELGNGTLYSSSIPLDIANLDGKVIALALPFSGSCALTDAGAVKCWGGGDFRETIFFGENITPTVVSGLDKNVKAIVGGSSHACALTNAGAVKCWGQNFYGQLGSGIGLTQTTSIPITIDGLGDEATAIAAGYAHTCALLKSGAIKCWGRNRWGQLGNNQSGDYSFPQFVTGLSSGVTAVSLGEEYSCALLQTGKMKCWGSDNYGQLGDGVIRPFDDIGTPTDVVSLTSGVKTIATGGRNTCAISSPGTVQCWGANWMGQLGVETAVEQSAIPLTIKGLGSNVNALAVSMDHTCALTALGSVLCWGLIVDNNNLGLGVITSTVPITVEGLSSGVKAITAGRDFNCVLTQTSGVKCWGNNVVFQIGIDAYTYFEAKPKDVVGLTSGVKMIASGYRHTCALLNSGSVMCWGHNNHGQLGDGTKLSRPAPVAVTGLSGAVLALYAGGDEDTENTCALTTTSLQCWGGNTYGQLGGAARDDLVLPKAAPLLADLTPLTLGGSHTCGITKAGGVKCLGKNTSGQLGICQTAIYVQPVSVLHLAFRAHMPIVLN
jgi:alpha-tubulin suppressor-like RCC1 family protein